MYHSTVHGLTARLIDDQLSWGVGTIQPQSDFISSKDQLILLQAVLHSIEPVKVTELPYSTCTDGRLPVTLQNGEAVPVREQLVGADMVSAFFAAEIMGANFYKNPQASAVNRVQEVAEFLKAYGLKPSSHIDCGAAANFTSIARNVLHFMKDKRFIARLKSLLPHGMYSRVLIAEIIQTLTRQLAIDAYQGLHGEIFLQIAQAKGGDRAIAKLKDDGRGMQGHVEEQIIRVCVPGKAINKAKVARLTGGRQVFGMNDTRLERMAQVLSGEELSHYHKLYLALELFTNAAHGTLAKNLPTWVIST